MLTATDRAYIRLNSNPCIRRTGLLPMAFAVVVSWIFVFLWGFASVIAFVHSIYWSLILLCSTCAFAVFLGETTYSLITDAYREYVLELNGAEAILSINDRLRHCRATQMILLDDVTYAEYYPYLDSASIILHADYAQMEIPIWPFGINGQDIIDFLSGRGVKVVNVQSDEQIPV